VYIGYLTTAWLVRVGFLCVAIGLSQLKLKLFVIAMSIPPYLCFVTGNQDTCI